MENRWVSVGVYTEEADKVVLRNAAVIRYWGTTGGLGQIAVDGPTPSTKLDKTPTEFIQKSKVIKTIECDEDKWKKALGL